MRLVGLWRDQPLHRVLSSPFVRCVQTVQPLAEAVGLAVEESVELAEGYAADAWALVQQLAAVDAALCTHGDIIPALLDNVDRGGATITDQRQWAKGSTWVLHAAGDSFTRAAYVPRPL